MIPRYTGGSYYRRAKGKGTLVKRQRPLLANIYSTGNTVRVQGLPVALQGHLKARVGLFLDFESKDRGDESCGEPELSDDLKDAANRKRKFCRDGTSGATYRPQAGDTSRCASNVAGRPSLTPFFFAAASPAFTRSRIISRSNSATAHRM